MKQILSLEWEPGEHTRRWEGNKYWNTRNTSLYKQQFQREAFNIENKFSKMWYSWNIWDWQNNVKLYLSKC
jgi:hypothetical protein